MINVLLIGNGAREHAIAEALKRNKSVRLYSFMAARNPGIIGLSEDYFIGNLEDHDSVTKFAVENTIGIAFIGPEAPLAAGIVDSLEDAGISCIGPTKSLARLETSKSFTRQLLEKHGIPGNPRYRVFTSMNGIKEFMQELEGNFVVKADGLCGGKGVKVVGDHLSGIEDGLEYCRQCIEKDGGVVVEEKLIGQEFSLMSFVDGRNVVETIPVQDHKRAYVGDKGPNTGGMGSYSDSNHLLPFLTKEELEQAHTINQLTCDALRKETGQEYKGIMYGGFIVTKNGVRLIEYNVRFGDPEVMNVLPILKTDFVSICQAMIDGTLDKARVEFDTEASVCKYAVPDGYPENPIKGEKIELSEVSADARLYYASVDKRDDGLYMSSSRAIAFVGIASTLEAAEAIAERAVSGVKGKIFHRKDIGTKELVQQRVKHMQQLRGK